MWPVLALLLPRPERPKQEVAYLPKTVHRVVVVVLLLPVPEVVFDPVAVQSTRVVLVDVPVRARPLRLVLPWPVC